MDDRLRHSNETGQPAIRGGATASEGTALKPANCNSSISGGALVHVSFMLSAIASDTRLITNSPVAMMFAAVSL
ncbi:hypothetical protein D3C81_2089350 [compost metagenome]